MNYSFFIISIVFVLIDVLFFCLIRLVLSNSLLFVIFLSKSLSLALTLDEVDEQDGENVEREPQQVEQGQRHKGRVGVQHVILVDLQ